MNLKHLYSLVMCLQHIIDFTIYNLSQQMIYTTNINVGQQQFITHFDLVLIPFTDLSNSYYKPLSWSYQPLFIVMKMLDKISFIVTNDNVIYSQTTDSQSWDLSWYPSGLLPMVGQELLLFQEQKGYQDSSLLFPALQQRPKQQRSGMRIAFIREKNPTKQPNLKSSFRLSDGMRLTGFEFIVSGACSCPDIHFHKSGFSCITEIGF